jgi:hypothetical protein
MSLYEKKNDPVAERHGRRSSGNGAILGLKKAPSKDFDPSVAGTYKAIFYQRTNARSRPGGVEAGVSTLLMPHWP